MPKVTNDMASDESYSKYDAAGAPVRKNGGNDAKHVAVRSKGEQYPKPTGSGSGKTE